MAIKNITVTLPSTNMEELLLTHFRTPEAVNRFISLAVQEKLEALTSTESAIVEAGKDNIIDKMVESHEQQIVQMMQTVQAISIEAIRALGSQPVAPIAPPPPPPVTTTPAPPPPTPVPVVDEDDIYDEYDSDDEEDGEGFDLASIIAANKKLSGE